MTEHIDLPDQPDGIEDDTYDLPDPLRAAERVGEYIAANGDGMYDRIGNVPLYARDLESLRRTVEESAVEKFNAAYPVGTPVRYWKLDRVGAGKTSTTRTPAEVLGAHTAVVWVNDEVACIALTHIQPIDVADTDSTLAENTGNQTTTVELDGVSL